jgi:hypothetical protein
LAVVTLVFKTFLEWKQKQDKRLKAKGVDGTEKVFLFRLAPFIVQLN